MKVRLRSIAVLSMACCLCFAGCNAVTDPQKDAESRLAGHWVAYNLITPDAEGGWKETPIPDGLYFDITPGGTFTATLPSEYDEAGHAISSSSYVGTWSFRAQIDPNTNAGFSYEFDGSFPTAEGSQGGTAHFFLSKSSTPNNPDVLMYHVSIGETNLQGFASINGKAS